MSSFKKYAEYYDLLYRDKDYEGESDFIEKVITKYSQIPVKTILDGGCGTGGHVLSLAKRGYEVLGVDISETMINRARGKAKQSKKNIKFEIMDLRTFDSGIQFDAAVTMFAVMGYLSQTKDIQSALANIRKHLKAGALYILDFWNGLAVMRILPSTKVKVVEDNNTKIIRIAEPELDALNHICRVNYKIMAIENNQVMDEIQETHIMRFFFPQEMVHYLDDSHLEVLKICPFPDLDGKVDENVWNIAVVARAV